MSLVDQVRDYANQNYNRDGWDFLVECWEDSDILDCINDATDFETAMLRCRKVTRALDQHRRDIRATADW